MESIISIAITYDVVTEESSKEGDVSERGWMDTQGWRYPEEDTSVHHESLEAQYDTVEEAAEYLYGEGVQLSEYTGKEYCVRDSDFNPDGECISRYYHIIASPHHEKLLHEAIVTLGSGGKLDYPDECEECGTKPCEKHCTYFHDETGLHMQHSVIPGHKFCTSCGYIGPV